MQPGVRHPALPDVEDGRERRESSGRVHDDAASEIEHTVRLQNSAAPHHVGYREIHQQQPRHEKEQIRLEGHTIREGAGNECGRDLGEHHLIRHEDDQRNRRRPGERCGGVDTLEEGEVEVSDDAADVRIRRAAVAAAEGHRIATHHPQHGRHAHRNEALQHDRQHVFPSDESPVEEGKPRRHEHDEARRHEHERDVASVPLHCFPPVHRVTNGA